MTTVTFAYYGESLASSRLRARIPQEELAKVGVHPGADVLVYGKHFLDFKQIDPFGCRIFDICDDHFRHKDLRSYYMEHAERADALTCNSVIMQARIREETGRTATVIAEPYESWERFPRVGDSLVWFGHQSNLCDLHRVAPKLKHPLVVLSNAEGTMQWTMDAFDRVMDSPSIVIIPTGKSLAKSENRMVESIRRGKYVCAEHLPAYEPFSCFFPLGDIHDHVEWVLNNIEQAKERVRRAQSFIRFKYSPAAIARQWLGVINGNYHLRGTENVSGELAGTL